jgi:hypothetical protein
MILFDFNTNVTELSEISQDIRYINFVSSEQWDLDEIVVNIGIKWLGNYTNWGSHIFKIKNCMEKIKFQQHWKGPNIPNLLKSHFHASRTNTHTHARTQPDTATYANIACDKSGWSEQQKEICVFSNESHKNP